MGKRRAYTGKTLLNAVKKYFRGISTTRPARDEMGEKIQSDLGKEILLTIYIEPPTVTGLCRHLGIDRRTWSNYADEEQYPEMREAVQYARDRMEEYLERELLTREKQVRGIIFNLQNNYGWRERQEVELGSETRKTMTAETLTIEDKLRAIKEAQTQMEASK